MQVDNDDELMTMMIIVIIIPGCCLQCYHQRLSHCESSLASLERMWAGASQAANLIFEFTVKLLKAEHSPTAIYIITQLKG